MRKAEVNKLPHSRASVNEIERWGRRQQGYDDSIDA
jgi:hypothetical protein